MNNNNEYNYPVISNKLIKCLTRDYPNVLPEAAVDAFNLGRLIGQQDIIKKLQREKEYNEKEELDEDDI